MVLFLGRLHPKKGLDILIRSFSLVKRSIRDAQLVIVGDGPESYVQKCRALAESLQLTGSVHFAGALDGDDVLAAYVDADVFSLPSHTENFGFVVVEAMACKLPVVISEDVHIWQDVVSAGAGINTTLSPEDHADGLLRVLQSDQPLRQAMGEAGRQAAKEYSWDRVAVQMASTYERVLNSAP